MAAAVIPAKPYPDVGRTDFLLQDQAGEVIRVQVKTTEQPERTAKGFVFDLDIATYDKLRSGSSPGYLVLVVMHARYPLWIRHDEDGSAVLGSVYWASLRGLPAKPGQTTVRMTFPPDHLLTSSGLLDLFPKEGGDDSGE